MQRYRRDIGVFLSILMLNRKHEINLILILWHSDVDKKCEVKFYKYCLWIFGGLLVSTWWLPVCSKLLGGGRDLWMVFCCNMNAGWVVQIPWGREDTQTLPYAKECFCTHMQWGCKNFGCELLTPSLVFRCNCSHPCVQSLWGHLKHILVGDSLELHKQFTMAMHKCVSLFWWIFGHFLLVQKGHHA